jgi:glycosyltransferase involved in cell wall biosynthesis
VTANPAATLYFLVPDTIDDPSMVSGGNIYDQHVRDGLTERGWEVRSILLAEASGDRLARALSELPDDSLVLADGLIAVPQSDVMVAHSSRLRVVVLAHMVASILPVAGTAGTAGSAALVGAAAQSEQLDRESRVLHAASRVLTTSHWTRSELISLDLAPADRIIVAQPGTDPAPATIASDAGGRLLCVATVAPHKGQDLLVRALAGLADIDGWTCTFAGSQLAEPEFVSRLVAGVESAGLADRVTFAGVLTGLPLADAYANADLVVAPSRYESYGMTVAEALARGIPVVATRVGGLSEATSLSERAMIIPPDDASALGAVLRQWLTSRATRTALKADALTARRAARSWSTVISVVSQTLEDVARAKSALPA